MPKTLKNDYITIQVNQQGAELESIKSNQTQKEYLWCADEKYWKRHSPILFPIVGGVRDKKYTYKGKTYEMPQHGFARDITFNIISSDIDEVWYQLTSNEKTKENYPFDFTLEIGYRLLNNKVIVSWKVKNTGKDTLHFQIGAHPAFNCPLNENEQRNDNYIILNNEKDLTFYRIGSNNLVVEESIPLETTNGAFKINDDLFAYDALIIEDKQATKVSLADKDLKPYITVEFDAPLFGLWFPPKTDAPFLCIEPWYGRSDGDDFHGSFEEKKYMNHLDEGGIFETSYSIEVL